MRKEAVLQSARAYLVRQGVGRPDGVVRILDLYLSGRLGRREAEAEVHKALLSRNPPPQRARSVLATLFALSAGVDA